MCPLSIAISPIPIAKEVQPHVQKQRLLERITKFTQMHKVLFIIGLVLLHFNSLAQALHLSEVGFEPALCRQFDYQNGNGLVYAFANGGTPAYDYLWEHLETGETSTTSTWGGRNPGTYKITVTDNVGTTVSSTIQLDSINVLANFHAFSDNLAEIPGSFIGLAPDTIGFINLSENTGYTFDPFGEAPSFWNFNHPTDDWFASYGQNKTVYKGFLFGGTYDICLVASNKNGCTDTTCKTIKLLGELAQLPNPEIPIIPSLHANNQKQQITINYGNSTPNLSLEIYNLKGQLVYQKAVNKQMEIIPFMANNGLYCYAFYNEKKELITTGKFYY